MTSFTLDHGSPGNQGSVVEFMLISAVEAIHNTAEQRSENKEEQ